MLQKTGALRHRATYSFCKARHAVLISLIGLIQELFMPFRTVIRAGLSVLAAGAIVALALGIIQLGHQHRAQATENGGQPAQGDGLLPVAARALQPEPGYLARTRLSGRVRAGRQVMLAFEPGGRVVDIAVELGDQVQAGDVLARLDQRRIRARLAEIDAGLRDAEISLDLARVEEQRQRELRDSDLNTRQALDQSVAARQRLEAGMELLRASRQSVQSDLDDTVLRAPFAGRVTERLVELGAMVTPASPAFRLLDQQRLEAHVGIPVSVSRLFSPGQAMELRINGKPVQGRLRSLLPEVDSNRRTLTLVVDLPEPAGVVPGELAEWVHEREVEEPGYWIAATALMAGDRGLWTVLVATPERDGTAVVGHASVELLHSNGDRVFVRGTLAPEMLLIEDGVHRVVQGQRVRLASVLRP